MNLPIKWFFPMIIAGAGGIMSASHLYPYPVQYADKIEQAFKSAGLTEEATLSDLEFWKSK